MVVPDVHAAEPCEQIQIPPALLVPHVHVFGPVEHAPVTEHSEQLGECRIDMTRVALDGARHADRSVRGRSVSRYSAIANVVTASATSSATYGG